jgi:hypothetical protein
VNVNDYEYLWRDRNAGWALVRVAPVPGQCGPRYVIENARTREALVIEDDELYAAVKQEMLRKGAPVIERDDLPPLDRPSG